MTGPRAIGVVEALAIVEETGLAVPREQLPNLIAGLTRVSTILQGRYFAPPASADDVVDRLLDAKEAAPLLGLSASTLYANADSYSFTVRPTEGSIRFSLRGIQRWIARQQGRR